MNKPMLVGGYINDLAAAVNAAVIGQEHMVAIGGPGTGKSTFVRSYATNLGQTLWISCDPTTPPSIAKGRPHIGALLETGQEITRVEGTFLDPRMRFVVADEAFRASDPLWDAMLYLLEKHDPQFLMTANWIAKGDRVNAFKDRVAIWCHLVATMSPAEAGLVAGSTMDRIAIEGTDDASLLGAMYTHPSWPDPAQVWFAWSCRPGPKAKAAVSAVVAALADEAITNKFFPNPRRVSQWSRILYRVTCYHTGQPEWGTVAPEAQKALMYAWPTESDTEAAKWKQVALKVVDKIGAIIMGHLAKIKEKLQAFAALDAAPRGQQTPEVAKFLFDVEGQLTQINDPRATEVIGSLNLWFRLASAGIDPWAQH